MKGLRAAHEPKPPRNNVGLVSRRKLSWVAAGLALVALTAVAGFEVVRPRVEAWVVARLQKAASQRGMTAAVARAHLTPWLTLDLRAVVLRHPSGWRVEVPEADIHPRFSWRGLTGHAALARVSKMTVYLPGELQVDVRPTTWAIDSSDDRVGVALADRRPSVAMSVSYGRESEVDVRFVAAPLSDLLQVSRNGCSVARLGTVDGDAQLLRRGTGPVDIRIKGRTRGGALASLSADGAACVGEAYGAPADVEVDFRGSVDPAAGQAAITQLVVRTRGIEALAQASLAGGTADPRVSLTLDVSRMDLADVLATAGLELPARDLGVASLSWRIDGRLLDPESMAVSQKLQFSPPQQPVPAIERLKSDFVHRFETPQGGTRSILVSRTSPDFVALDDVPPLFLKALLLAEDTDFYGHKGVDLRELPIAFATNFARGTFLRGASTIPQQLAKNLFLTRRKTVSRKAEEAALALLLDATLGKRRELEIYLNVIEWGPGIYGLRPAARYYFGHEPSELDARQMAFLVVLIPGPVKYQSSFASGTPSPFFEGMMTTLIGKLLTTGALSEQDYSAALAAPLDLRVPTTSAPQVPPPGR